MPTLLTPPFLTNYTGKPIRFSIQGQTTSWQPNIGRLDAGVALNVPPGTQLIFRWENNETIMTAAAIPDNSGTQFHSNAGSPIATYFPLLLADIQANYALATAFSITSNLGAKMFFQALGTYSLTMVTPAMFIFSTVQAATLIGPANYKIRVDVLVTDDIAMTPDQKIATIEGCPNALGVVDFDVASVLHAWKPYQGLFYSTFFQKIPQIKWAIRYTEVYGTPPISHTIDTDGDWIAIKAPYTWYGINGYPLNVGYPVAYGWMTDRFKATIWRFGRAFLPFRYTLSDDVLTVVYVCQLADGTVQNANVYSFNAIQYEYYSIAIDTSLLAGLFSSEVIAFKVLMVDSSSLQLYSWKPSPEYVIEDCYQWKEIATETINTQVATLGTDFVFINKYGGWESFLATGSSISGVKLAYDSMSQFIAPDFYIIPGYGIETVPNNIQLTRTEKISTQWVTRQEAEWIGLNLIPSPMIYVFQESYYYSRIRIAPGSIEMYHSKSDNMFRISFDYEWATDVN